MDAIDDSAMAIGKSSYRHLAFPSEYTLKTMMKCNEV